MANKRLDSVFYAVEQYFLFAGLFIGYIIQTKRYTIFSK